MIKKKSKKEKNFWNNFLENLDEDITQIDDVDIREKIASPSARLKKSGIVVNFTVLIIGVIVFFLCISALNDNSDEQNSPLYVDLMESSAYTKRGFDPAILSIKDVTVLTNKDAVGWESVLPPDFQGAYMISNLLPPNGNELQRKSLFLNARDHEYTILIPFELSAEALESTRGISPLTPGVHFSGIGENWEVYINGTLIASEMHLDDNGQVLSSRSLRDKSFPVDNNILKSGTNTIIIRIIGAYTSADTGLYFSSGNYLGDFAGIITTNDNVINIVFCTIYFFMGLYHLLLFFMRRSTWYNLTYCFFAITITFYVLSRTAMFHIVTMDSAIIQRLEYGLFYAIPLMLATFIEQLAFGRVRRLTKIYGVIMIVLLLLQLISIDFANDLLIAGQILCAVMIFYIIIFDIAIPFVQRVMKQNKNEENVSLGAVMGRNFGGTPLGNIFLAGIFLASTGIYDVVNSIFAHKSLLLTQYSFFLFTISAAFILARHFANTFERVNAENETLEATVQARTIALERQIMIAEQASRAKGDFLANMSHEIRTPINAVIGMTTIGRQTEDVDKKNYSFDRIVDASTHLLGVINNILDMSKIEADKLELYEVAFDLRNMVKNITEVIRVKTNEKKQLLSVFVDKEIPDIVLGDDQRLAQVITNLLSNAIKFTPEKGFVSLDINLVEQIDEEYMLSFAVADTGIGITTEQQKRLFTSFQQADNSTSRSYGGTGLGLALSKRIVELMSGTISVKSMPGEGATFIFTAMLHKADDKSVDECESIGDVTLREGEFEARTILIVDDIEINREILTTIFEPSGLNMLNAENGKVALDMFLAHANDLDAILMDVQMPIMDGYMATKEIRNSNVANAKTIPIIAMTANVFKEDIEKCVDAGMNQHVGKPIDISELIVLLRKYFQG